MGVIPALDDFTSDITTNGRLTVGSMATGWVDAPGDMDWFAVALEKGKAYRFELEGAMRHPRVTGVYGARGDLIHAGEAGELRFTASANATYHVEVGALGDRGG